MHGACGAGMLLPRRNAGVEHHRLPFVHGMRQLFVLKGSRARVVRAAAAGGPTCVPVDKDAHTPPQYTQLFTLVSSVCMQEPGELPYLGSALSVMPQP